MLLGTSRAKAQTWEQLNDSFYYYFEKEDFNRALTVAQKVVEVARNDFGEADQQYATALNNLAFTYYKSGNLAAAEDNFLECFNVKLRVYEPDDERCLSTAQMLSDIYKQQQNYKEAEKLLTGYLQILSKKNKQQSKAFVYSLFMRGDGYRVLKQNDRAITDFLGILNNEKEFITDTALLYGAYEALADLYGDVSDLQKGERIFLRHTEFCKAVDGEQSENYVFALFRLAGFYGRAKIYQESQRLLDKVAGWYKVNKGPDSEDYYLAAQNSVLLLCKLKNYSSADSMMDVLLNRKKQLYGEGSLEYENAIHRAGIVFMQAENYNKAEDYFKKSVALSRNAKRPSLLFSRLVLLDSLYEHQNITLQRPPVLAEIIDLHEKHKLLTDSAYGAKLLLLANTYRRNGTGDKAVALIAKADSVIRKAYKEKTNTFINALTIIANVYTDAGMLDKADNYYQQALSLAAFVWKEDPESYAGLLNVVGQMYNEAGFYKKAEDMFTRALQSMEKSKSTNYKLWSSIMYHSGDVKSTLKKNAEAEEALRAAVKYAKEIAVFSNEYLMYTIMLAEFYQNNKLYTKADSIHQALSGLLNKPGDILYEQFLNSIVARGKILLSSGNSERAEQLVDSAIHLAEQYYMNNEWNKTLLFRLSHFYNQLNKFEKGIYYGEKLYQQEKIQYGDDEKSLFAARTILYLNYLGAGDYAKTASVVSELNKSSFQFLRNNLDAFSDAEKERYLYNKVRAIHLSNTLLFYDKKVSQVFLKESFNQVLLLKSLVLAESRKLLESVISGSDTSLQRLYSQWLSARSDLSREYAKPLVERRKDIALLEDQAESLQKEMNQKSALLRKRQQDKSIVFTDIQQSLQETEAAIEFVSFSVVREKADSIMYAAYVLRKNDSLPVFVPLFEQKQLQKLLDAAGTNATSMVSQFYRGLDMGNTGTAASLGKDLYNLVWSPLEPYLKGIKKISYSPAGKLYSIAFHALPADSTILLMDKYELQQYFSTKEVAVRNELVSTNISVSLKPKSIGLFGGASFNLVGSTTIKQSAKNKNTSGFYLPVSRGSDNNVWSALPGTAEEVKKIKKQFELNKVPSKVYTQSAASEENLKALSGNSPQVLHIATHGFFLPEPEKKEEDNSAENKNVYILANDPLLRSGLILSGGNHAWSGKTPVEGMEDGIATAYEISQLNLSNTELVVLSACETALGDVRGSEGVFGLQRAFKMAGVKKMIVSLWQVPDKETAELMTAFYNYWLKGKTIEQAFAQAQSDMRKKYSPYYWAAFVLVE